MPLDSAVIGIDKNYGGAPFYRVLDGGMVRPSGETAGLNSRPLRVRLRILPVRVSKLRMTEAISSDHLSSGMDSLQKSRSPCDSSLLVIDENGLILWNLPSS